MSFSDFPYLAANEPEAKKNALRSLDITRAYALAFFDKYLKHLPDSLLDMQPAPYPEVTSEHFSKNFTQ